MFAFNIKITCTFVKYAKKNLGEFIGGARAHLTPIEGSAVPGTWAFMLR